MKLKPHLFIAIICSVFLVLKTFSQKPSSISLDYTLGRSEVFSNNYPDIWAHNGKTTGIGISLNELNDRLCIKPHGSITFYDAKHITDTPDQYSNEFRVGLNIQYNVVLYRQFSLFIQPGIDLSIFKGLTGTGGWVTRTNSDYINQAGYFFNLGAGLSYKLKTLPLKLAIIPYERQHGKIAGQIYRGKSSYLTLNVYI